MIKVNDLSFSYSKKQPIILKHLTFNIEEGEIFGLLGPSGAGKSTLQKILLGLLKEYEGEVEVGNQNIKHIKNNYYDKIGVGFELPNLYEQLTVYENLKSFSMLYSNPADISKLLTRLNLYEHKDKKVKEISKGMKMRLNFCRALIGSPQIIFLDEPTSGLDPNNVKIIQDVILEEKSNGKTIILTTHNMSFAEKICDRVAFIVSGEIKEIGAPKELENKYGEKKLVVEMKGKSLEEIFTIVTGRVLV